MDFLKEVKKATNLTTTENGAGAYKSTLNANLDAFGVMGSMRREDESEILHLFIKAFNEDRETAMRLIFYMRDIRGGQGARRVFRVCMKWLAKNYPEYVINNLDNFLEYGRGDDVLELFDTAIENDVITWMYETLRKDYLNFKANKSISLLAKWMPSENASSQRSRILARRICKKLNWSAKNYRIMLTTLRKYLDVVERNMSARQWSAINYEAVPSKAGLHYRNAFMAHDSNRYIQYLKDIAEGKAKVNAAALFPVDITKEITNRLYGSIQQSERYLYDAMWNALPNYFEGKEETGICVVDTSGSMHGTPMDVALSLGMYCADKCRGPFKGHFITFSEKPELQEIWGTDIVDKVRNMSRAGWNMNTDLEKVFDLILNVAVKNHADPKDIPQKLYIISDMQFDSARGAYNGWYRANPEPFMQTMRRKYAKYGYELPMIVYWNVDTSNCGMFQETFEGENCCMVSGYSPSLFKAVIEGTTYEEVQSVKNGEVVRELRATLDPLIVMNTALYNERYDKVWVG